MSGQVWFDFIYFQTSITSSGDQTISVDDEIEKMRQKMAVEMSRMREELQQLMPLEKAGYDSHKDYFPFKKNSI